MRLRLTKTNNCNQNMTSVDHHCEEATFNIVKVQGCNYSNQKNSGHQNGPHIMKHIVTKNSHSSEYQLSSENMYSVSKAEKEEACKTLNMTHE